MWVSKIVKNAFILLFGPLERVDDSATDVWSTSCLEILANTLNVMHISTIQKEEHVAKSENAGQPCTYKGNCQHKSIVEVFLLGMEGHKQCCQARCIADADENVFLCLELVAHERVVKWSCRWAHNHDADAGEVESAQSIHLSLTHTREVMVKARKRKHEHSSDRLHVQGPAGEAGKRAFNLFFA